jgi:hypothetical protein
MVARPSHFDDPPVMPEFPPSGVETASLLAGRPAVNEMSTNLRASARVVLLAVVAVLGCSAKVDTIDHPATTTAGATMTTGWEDTETPLETEHEPPPVGPATYPSCLLALLSPEQVSCPGGVDVVTDLPSEHCVACWCREPCDVDSDCAAPVGVTAEGECGSSGACVLRCDGGRTCPEGMSCSDQVLGTDHPDGYQVCLWATNDEFACAEIPWEPGNPCSDITDASACNAKTSHVAGDHCTWVEETILSSGSSTCEAAGALERCVWAKPTDCEGPEACPSADARVYWRDLGAGTVALATFGCDIRPSDSEAYESCDFGSDVAIPLVCDCGCD